MRKVGNKENKEEILDENISESHVSSYLNRIRSGLFTVLLFMTLTEILTFILVKNGLLSHTLSNAFIQSRWTTDENYITRYLITIMALNWGLYLLYNFLYKFLDFKRKKFFISFIFLAIVTIYAFGHLGFIHLSILYTIPIVFTCPLGQKYHRVTLVLSLILSSIYTIYQYLMMGTEYNFLVGILSLTAIIITYLICKCLYTSFTNALRDVEQYSKLSTKLYDEIGHDFVTGAYSKVALKNDLEKEKDFRSIAFLDLDDFKEINDTKSHQIGDGVLQALVKSAESKNERIYRYGGDEFIVLSKLKVYDLYAKILQIKTTFNDTCIKEFQCDATFSAGITSIKEGIDSETLINQSDGVMYISKKNGKNQITVEE